MELHDFVVLAAVAVIAVIAFAAITRGLGAAIDWFAGSDDDAALNQSDGDEGHASTR